MTKRVYKYPIPNNKHFMLSIPSNSQFLRVAMQNDMHQVWFIVDVDSPPVERKFRLYGTGQDIQPGANWLFTYDNGPFVLHLFEV